MVLLGTLLRLQISDLPGGLVLLEDRAQTQGSTWLLLRHLLHQPWSAPKTLLVTNPLSLSLAPSQASVLDLSVAVPDPAALRALPAGSMVLVDSLDAMVVLLGETETKKLVQDWRSAGCCCVCVSSCEFAVHCANVRVRVCSWDGLQGTADCIHLRGYTKVTRELCAFALEHDTITTSALEKPKILPKPIAVPQTRPLVILEEEDLQSPDEEGDEDDLI